MGMWIELGVFLLVFVFAWHQLRDLKKRARQTPSAERRSQSQPRRPTNRSAPRPPLTQPAPYDANP